MKEKIKPCRCGETGFPGILELRRTNPPDFKIGFMIGCPCGERGPRADTPEEAIIGWNGRP